jgi:outer membrane protein assembly factor BamB
MNKPGPANPPPAGLTGAARHSLLPAAILTAAIAAIFSLTLCGILVLGQRSQERRWAGLCDRMEQLRPVIYAQNSAPAKRDEAAAAFRRLDQEYRQDLLYRDGLQARGGYVLAGAIIIMLLSAHWAAGLEKKPPMPRTPIDQARLRKVSARATWAVAACGLIASGLAISWLVRSPADALSTSVAQAGGHNESASAQPAGAGQTPPQPGRTSPTDDTAAFDPQALANWPRFRGTYGAGISTYDISKYGDVPQTWDAAAGKNILWKSDIPLAGMSSPIVWGNRVFITGANDDKAQIFCYDADNGNLLWAADVRAPAPGKNAGAGPAKQSENESDINDAGPAAPTPATDGKRVFAIFPTGDLAAVDFDGKPVWSQALGEPKSEYGYGTSLAICGQTLLVLLDQKLDAAGQQKSRLLALDCATGDERWEASRDVAPSWATPIVIQAAGKMQVVTCADPWVISYDLLDGRELWRAKCLDGDVAPSPVFDGTYVYAVNEGARLVAIRPDGSGDVTSSHIVWKEGSGLPKITSPLAADGLVYMITSEGILTCLDARSRARMYQHQFKDGQDHPISLHSSPAMAGGRIYIIADDGLTSVIQAGKEFKLLDTANLGEPCHTCPALANGRIYIRCTDHLFCIGDVAAVPAMRPTGVPPVPGAVGAPPAIPSSSDSSTSSASPAAAPRRQGQDGPATHGRDARATTQGAP